MYRDSGCKAAEGLMVLKEWDYNAYTGPRCEGLMGTVQSSKGRVLSGHRSTTSLFRRVSQLRPL